MKQDFQNKRVTVMGLGLYEKGSGIEAVKFFLRHGAKLIITDLKNEKDLKKQVSEIKKSSKLYALSSKPKFVLGRHREEDFKNADLIFQNPSVPADSPYLKIARKHKIPIVNDWSIFLAEHQPKVFIGVTGTRGKSTTTALIYEMLKQGHSAIPRNRRMKVWLTGNLGVSPLSFIDKYKGEPIVAELSSWLLHHFADVKKSPNIAVVTNIMNDHLNKYPSIKEYIADKENIFKFQGEDVGKLGFHREGSRASECVILNYDNKITRAMNKHARGKVVWFSLEKHWPRWVSLDSVQILGEHNKANALAAAVAAETAGVSREHIIDVLKTFKGLPNRLQLTRAVRGVRYYNDTTATTPDATIVALKTLAIKRLSDKEIKNIVLIAGGADKKLEYKELAREIKKYCKAIVLLPGNATDKIKKNLATSYYLLATSAKNMAEAVKKAQALAKKGDIVLLSPAAASFGLFSNEFDRGDQFVACVKKL